MKRNKQLTVTLNQTGIDLNEDEIDDVLDINSLGRLRQLEEENSRLKHMYAEFEH